MKTIKFTFIAIAVLWFVAPPGFINLSALAGIVPDINMGGIDASGAMARFLVWAGSCFVGLLFIGVLGQLSCLMIPFRMKDGEVVEPKQGECHARTFFQVVCATLTIVGIVILFVMAMIKLSYVLGV